MDSLSAERMARYRRLVAATDMPEAQKDELIAVVHDVLRALIDQSFGRGPVTLSLSKKANSHFLGAADYASFLAGQECQRVDHADVGANNDLSLMGPDAP